jgi:outer membrane protein TolC
MTWGGKQALFLTLAALLCLGSSGVAFAEDAASPDTGREARADENAIPLGIKTIALGIDDVVVRALESSLDIEIERLNSEIKEAEALSATGVFDPTLRLEFSYDEEERPQTTSEGLASNAGTTERVSKDLALTLEGKLVPGTEYALKFDREQSQFTQKDTFIDPDPLVIGDEFFSDIRSSAQYNLDASLTLTQPLLKDFGANANLTEIRIARGEKDMSAEDFQKRVMDIIAEAESAYWDLVATIENLRVSEQSLALARDLLEENWIRLEVGAMARLEVLQAETGVAQREEEVITARRLIEDVEDNLKRILNLPKNTEEWKTRIEPTDAPSVVDEEIDLLAQLELALEKRPDYKSSLMRIENDAIKERFAQNQTLPTVDIIAEGQSLAVAAEFDDAFDDVAGGNALSWMLGVTAEYPIGNRAAKGELTKARLERLQSEKEAENLRLSIIVEVNKAVRDIRASLKRIEVTAKGVELAEESLKAERKKLEVGVSTSHNVLEFEDELADTRRREILAKLDHAKALINLSNATGTLLEENNIVIEESF